MRIYLQEICFLTAIGNAVAILTDTEKRKQYDTYGPEEERMHNVHSRQSHTHYNYTRGFEGKRVLKEGMCVMRISYKFMHQNVIYNISLADITAEELFNMFFGVGFPQQEFYMRRPGGRWMRQSDAQAQHAHSQVEQKDVCTVRYSFKVLFFSFF